MTTYTLTRPTGETLRGTAEEIARTLTGPDAHPALLADTVREVEYHGTPVEVEVETGPRYEVVKEEWDIPCDHYACEMMHRHLATRRVDPFWTDVYNLAGEKVGRREVSRVHDVKRTDWLVIDTATGDRVEGFDRRRDARAHAALLNR